MIFSSLQGTALQDPFGHKFLSQLAPKGTCQNEKFVLGNSHIIPFLSFRHNQPVCGSDHQTTQGFPSMPGHTVSLGFMDAPKHRDGNPRGSQRGRREQSIALDPEVSRQRARGEAPGCIPGRDWRWGHRRKLWMSSEYPHVPHLPCPIAKPQ